MSFPPHQRITNAIRTAESEIEIVEDERSAYRSFVRRLDRIDTADDEPVTATNHSGMQVAAVESPSVSKALREAREAYRETVMATPHYDREYSESLWDHVEIEFGSSVANQFAKGNVLTPFLRRSLRDGAAEAIRQRAELLKSLESERDSLQNCHNIVVDAQNQLNKCYIRLNEEPDTANQCEIDNQLELLESKCDTTLKRRQQHIDNRSGIQITDDNTDFSKYLYESHDSYYPVLTSVIECIETVRTCRIHSLR